MEILSYSTFLVFLPLSFLFASSLLSIHFSSPVPTPYILPIPYPHPHLHPSSSHEHNRSPELVIALVRNAKEDGGLRVFNMGEMFRASGRPECLSSVTDDDIKVPTARAYLLSVGSIMVNHPPSSWLSNRKVLFCIHTGCANSLFCILIVQWQYVRSTPSTMNSYTTITYYDYDNDNDNDGELRIWLLLLLLLLWWWRW